MGMEDMDRMVGVFKLRDRLKELVAEGELGGE